MPKQTATNDHDPTFPQIAWDIASLMSTSRAAHALWSSIGPHSLRDATDAARESLVLLTKGVEPKVLSREVVIAALVQKTDEHGRKAINKARRDKDQELLIRARAAVRSVTSGELAEALRGTWDAVEDPGPLNDYIDSLREEGIDGHALCWDVIGYEAQRHIRLIWHEANKLTKSFPDRTPADLFGWGWIGLRVALRNFDPAKGFRFSTYACSRISGSIRDGVRAENPVPKRLNTFARKVTKAEEVLTAELGRVPQLHELAAHLGEQLDSLLIMPRLSPAASLDEMQDNAAARGAEISWLVSSQDPAQEALNSARRDAIDEAINQLDDEVAVAVRMLLYEGRSVAEAREVTGATARQLRARCAKGKEQLAEALAGWVAV